MDIASLIANIARLRDQIKDAHISNGKTGASGQPINPLNHLQKILDANQYAKTDLASEFFTFIFNQLNNPGENLPAAIFGNIDSWSDNTKGKALESMAKIIAYAPIAEAVNNALTATNLTLPRVNTLIAKYKKIYINSPTRQAPAPPQQPPPQPQVQDPPQNEENANIDIENLPQNTEIPREQQRARVQAPKKEYYSEEVVILKKELDMAQQSIVAKNQQIIAKDQQIAIYKDLADKYWQMISDLVKMQTSSPS
jgi:hypothetical protein